MKKSWYDIRSSATGTSVDIFDSIGQNGITAKDFIGDLNRLRGVPVITVRINSPGGAVADGVAIYNALKQHPAQIEVSIEGYALSIASYVAMAGDTVRMGDNALMMIHAPWLSASGNATDFRRNADVLDKAAEALISGYQRSGKSREEIIALMESETWFTALEAKAAGFVDEVFSAQLMAAHFDLTRFNIPARLKGKTMSSFQTPATINAADELSRRNEISTMFNPFKDRAGVAELREACLFDFQCSAEIASQKLLVMLGRSAEPANPRGAYPHMNDPRSGEFVAACTDALLMRAGLRVSEPNPQSRDVSRLRVSDMAARLLSMRGLSTEGMGPNDIIQAAGSHATSDFPILLSNTASKALRLGYENEPSTHTIWTREIEVQNFKLNTLAAISEAPDMQLVGEGDEYTYGSFSEAGETFAVATYGRIFAITRQALINDDLGAFTRLPQAFGASARRKEADLVYSKLTGSTLMADGVALFHSSHGNLVAATALTLQSLSTARAAMRLQKGVAGKAYLDLRPAFLIVPVALETTAEQLISQLVIPNTAANSTVEWIRSLAVIADPRLDAVSSVSWYLAAAPTQAETIIRAYLTGEERIHTEEDVKFETDSMSVKARMDIAVAAADWRGLVRNPGA